MGVPSHCVCRRLPTNRLSIGEVKRNQRFDARRFGFQKHPLDTLRDRPRLCTVYPSRSIPRASMAILCRHLRLVFQRAVDTTVNHPSPACHRGAILPMFTIELISGAQALGWDQDRIASARMATECGSCYRTPPPRPSTKQPLRVISRFHDRCSPRSREPSFRSCFWFGWSLFWGCRSLLSGLAVIRNS